MRISDLFSWVTKVVTLTASAWGSVLRQPVTPLLHTVISLLTRVFSIWGQDRQEREVRLT